MQVTLGPVYIVHGYPLPTITVTKKNSHKSAFKICRRGKMTAELNDLYVFACDIFYVTNLHKPNEIYRVNLFEKWHGLAPLITIFRVNCTFIACKRNSNGKLWFFDTEILFLSHWLWATLAAFKKCDTIKRHNGSLNLTTACICSVLYECEGRRGVLNCTMLLSQLSSFSRSVTEIKTNRLTYSCVMKVMSWNETKRNEMLNERDK